ncbi:uncharacterized protein LOC135480308 [Liolophura sinensis]|uniref:uncharacterized protein LOC135480308 n=1 Tax=Liolophura sinensis TaxID=3198878 RepID=UPI00315977B7
MRPAVQASVLRNRVKRVRRITPQGPHRFSLRRLLLLTGIGTVIFISGVGFSVVGYEKGRPDPHLTAEQAEMYRALGPIGCVVGTALLFGACMYYYCFGTGDGYGPRAPQSPATSTSYHPISSIRSAGSAQHRHHGNHSQHGHHGDHPHGYTTGNYDAGQDGMTPLTNEYLSDHDHHQIMMAAGCAPLASHETASIRDTPSGVPSEISIAVENSHPKHTSTSAPSYHDVTSSPKVH